MVEFDPSQLNLSLLALGAYIIVFGLFSFVLKERANIGESPIAILLGIALGPHGVFNLLSWASSGDDSKADSLMLGLSRIVLGVQLTLIGVQLPFRFLKTELVSLLVLVGPVMTMMWLATTLCIRTAFPTMPVFVSLIVAACTTATDPVLSNSIVKGEFADAFVSVRLRNLISAESGLNDGLCYPMLYIAIFILREVTVGEALTRWTLDTLLWQIAGSIVYGIVVGYVCLLLLRFATRSGFIDKESFLLYGVGMGVFVVGSAGLLGTDDLLAAFISGNVLTWDDRYRVDTEDDEVTNVIDLLLNQTFFLFVGLMIPFDLFNQPEYGITPARLVYLSILVLLFRRLPALLLHYRLIPSVRDSSEAAFTGYLGPIGAGACFYASLVLEEFKADDPNPTHQLVRIYVKPLTYALVLASIAGHSLMVPVLKAFLVYNDIGRIKLDDSASDFGDSDGSTIGATQDVREAEDGCEVEPSSSGVQGAGAGAGGSSSAVSSHLRRPHSYTTSVHRTHSFQSAVDNGAAGGGAVAQHILTPRHFEPGAGTPSSWRMSSGHKLPSTIAHDERGEEVYFLDRDTPSAWTRAAREGRSGSTSGGVAAQDTSLRSRSRSRSRSSRRPISQQSADLEQGNLTLPNVGTDGNAAQSTSDRYTADD
ncbi:hypothetical protein CF319_g1823 [Tilletia indica]|nr:hypothetical protein CF319_g1823 [Tilletia indica]KAE8227883.1 hypothetical protein CF326_g7206 [Tilletia indica]